MPDAFVSRVARALVALRPPARLLVAVSGGGDSVALLGALAEARKRRDLRDLALVVGHVDHQLRSPAEGVADEALVRSLADRFGLAFHVARVAVSNEGGLEEAARRARYDALVRLARDASCEAIVVAHTATDQAETLLLRLVRGAGARGLGAMAPERTVRGLRLLRPMLDVEREAARAYCGRAGLPFHDDPTNDGDRPRARLRREVLPVLESIGKGAAGRLAEAAARLRRDDELLARRAGLLVHGRDGAHVLARLPEPLLRRALVAWFEEKTGSRRRLAATHVVALERLVTSRRGAVELPGSRTVRRVAVIREGRLHLEELLRTNRTDVVGRLTSVHPGRQGSTRAE